MTESEMLEKLLSKKELSESDKALLRRILPEHKFEDAVLQLSKKRGSQALVRQLFKLQNILYAKQGKKKKRFKVVPTVDGQVVDQVVLGGLPGLGKKR